jgi:hypothetical protein
MKETVSKNVKDRNRQEKRKHKDKRKQPIKKKRVVILNNYNP